MKSSEFWLLLSTIYDVTKEFMENIIAIFDSLGLSENEIKMYMMLLKWWRQSTTTLAKKLNKPRTTLYSYTDSLLKKGFIQVEQTPRGQRFNALSFDNLLIAIEQKKKTIGDSVNELIEAREEYEHVQTQMSFIPKIKIYETKEARNLAYKKLQHFKEAYSIFNYDAAIKFLQRNKKRREQVGSIPHDSKVKEILIDSPNARKYKKKREHENKWNHEVRLINAKKLWNIKSDILLVDWVFYHTSLGERVVMIEINDPIFYESQKAIFEYLRTSIK